ncbi:MAG TPA: FlgD immunoglobulin-like domain containing protein, partial [candidate division Zixibacteria bacterium]|nr:FlgD immunoglobulin-like domain containing protein [candidate division Zixibacteria bacterium]
ASEVDVAVFNLLGQRIATLSAERLPSGEHELAWDAGGVASGIYFVRATSSDGATVTRKALLLK